MGVSTATVTSYIPDGTSAPPLAASLVSAFVPMVMVALPAPDALIKLTRATFGSSAVKLSAKAVAVSLSAAPLITTVEALPGAPSVSILASLALSAAEPAARTVIAPALASSAI